ncbi:MAG: hypothetical protein QOF33_4519 [Thermomicrobiales bacterium]|jgi:hypothetical protein|nr:hypothetical protein [Thermomicrobiales bacterium]
MTGGKKESTPLEAASFSLRPYHLEQLRMLAHRYGVSQSHVLREALDLAFATWRDEKTADSMPSEASSPEADVRPGIDRPGSSSKPGSSST